MRRWGLRGLLASWAAYWVGLIAIRLGPAVGPIWTATHSTAHGTVSVSTGSDAFSLVVTTGGATTYTTSIGVLPLVLWLALPPLALWFLWLASRPSARQRNQRHAPDALPAQSASEIHEERRARPDNVRRG